MFGLITSSIFLNASVLSYHQTETKPVKTKNFYKPGNIHPTESES